MKKWKSIGIVTAIYLLFSGFFCVFSYTDIIHLKNGGEVEGNIIKETEDTVIVDISAGIVAFNKGDISSIEKCKYTPKQVYTKKSSKKPMPSETIETQIRSAFKEYILALEKYDVEKYRYLISNQSIKAGEGNVKRFQMRNQYNQVFENPFTVRISRNRKEALLVFKDSRKGTANPYIMVYEDNRWKVDLIQMWRRIKFGPGNKWYWADAWNK